MSFKGVYIHWVSIIGMSFKGVSTVGFFLLKGLSLCLRCLKDLYKIVHKVLH